MTHRWGSPRTRRLNTPVRVGALILAMAGLAFGACSDGASAPEPTPTATPTGTPTRTATPISPVPTATLAAAPTADPTVDPTVEVQARCSDPYPEGAPHETEPGKPIRLRPAGSPPRLDGYEPISFQRDQALEEVVRESLGEEQDHFAVVVKNTADGRGAVVASNRTFYAASLFKLWVMLEVYHQQEAGLLDLGERYVVSDYYANEFGLNAGELAICDDVAVDEALRAMIALSDNVAANMLLDRVGAGNVNAALGDLGLEKSELPADGSLPTTAADLALLLEAIARRQAVSEAASEEMLALLLAQGVADRLPALLPAGTAVAHKTGNWANATHDVGIVFSPKATYVIAVLTDYGFGEDGSTPIARLSRAVYDYYNGGADSKED